MEDEIWEGVSFTIRPGRKRQLEDLAAKEDRSVSWLIRKIVDDYLDHQETA